ncbi:ABC transporter permease subunit [Salisediminibacterium halotolerans]|uniref:ABC-2 type transport system permease protein n=1 Tax=Salisediminibacterium halotolerans TaxID=517425 RepID=A0A1H9TJK9_9BACI|nr:ABC transporter permease subunit [Salisediminibacterium haloalkalitolerans]SER97039.1 hypothetical protein SAMN05444126_11040 [Salisediminibacterium haloalkalitolerans]
MFDKGLWLQNYKQTKLVIGLMFALYLIHMPFQAVLAIETWMEREEMADSIDDYVYEVQRWDVLQVFSEGIISVFLLITVVVLAGLLIGLERNTRKMDFAFSLPYKRRDLFWAKWAFGSTAITAFHSFSFLSAFLIIWFSPYQDAFNQVTTAEILIQPFVGMILIFTFALFVGTFTGEMISQMVVTVLLGFFPLGIYHLTERIIDIHLNFILPIPRLLDFITPFMYVLESDQHSWMAGSGIIGIIIFLSAGKRIYERNELEHNGEFLIFKSLHRPAYIVIVLMISMFGGTILSSLAPWNADILQILSYWIGFFGFLLFALLITRKVLEMNVLIKSQS